MLFLVCSTAFLGTVSASTTTLKHRRSLQVANHVLNLGRSASTPTSSRHLLVQATNTTFISSFDLAADGEGYTVNATFGTESFTVLFDTGSSDIWLATNTFECVDEYGDLVDSSFCAFGPGFDDTYSGGVIPDENFNVTYGDGEFLIGTLGYETITLAGLTVGDQEMALVDYGYWVGDGVVSGLMGFAYSSLTSAYFGDDPTTDDPNTTAALYTPFFFNAIDQGSVDSIFSLALERSTTTNGGPGGQLALGGLPTIEFNQTFATTPLEVIELIPDPVTATNFSYYTITPDGFDVVSTASYTTWITGNHNSIGRSSTRKGQQQAVNTYMVNTTPVIVDSGTTLIWLPLQITEAVNAAFDPPSRYSEEEGVFINSCDATPPTFSVRIAGQDFLINSLDMLMTPGGDSGLERDFCVSGVQYSDSVAILGDVFLKNVVAVFDIGASEMRFAPHVDY